MELTGKVALVLGSVKGIGKAVGLDLARAGARVVYTHHDWPESLPDLERDAAAAGCDHLIVAVDLRDTRAAEELVARVVARFGRLDILINNIERGGWPVVHGPYTPEQWDLEMATTLRAKQWVFAAALPHLKAAGAGVAINFSSIAAMVGRSGPASHIFNEGYAAANRGVSLLTETWARLGAPEVRVNEIMLGIFETRHAEETRGWGLLDDHQRQAVLDHTLLGRTGRLADVVKAVRFMIADAPFMTGTVLRLDGGYVLGGEKIGPMPTGVV
ncbi:MAG: SDR family oxidoreductase [Desulfatitalea sp.]|nr:SDR family oxidoreductase [Desulfatitalea sp.]